MSFLLAQHFYTSGTFWSAAGVGAAIGVGVAAVWATLRANNPKRRITYLMTDTGLVQTHQGLVGVIEIRRNGVVLINPRVVRIKLTNTSRRDVGSGDFDQQIPIKMDVGTPILELLGSPTGLPRTSATPVAVLSGSELHIGPGRIGKGESIEYLVLVDGRTRYKCEHTLLNINVVNEETETDESGRIWG
jgi:hypothetical protein